MQSTHTQEWFISEIKAIQGFRSQTLGTGLIGIILEERIERPLTNITAE